MKLIVGEYHMRGGEDSDDELFRIIDEYFQYAHEVKNIANPPASPNLCEAQYFYHYYSNVLNGGHAQFVGNAGKNASTALKMSSAILTKAGEPEVSGIAGRAKDWVEKNPAEASRQTGFTGGGHMGVASALKSLDEELFKIARVRNPFESVARLIRRSGDLESIASSRTDDIARAWDERLDAYNTESRRRWPWGRPHQ